MWDSRLLILLLAVLLDWLLGDPRRLPHCVHYVAWIAKQCERFLWVRGKSAVATGAVFYLLVLCFTLGPAWLLLHGGRSLWLPLSLFVAVFLVFQSIAWRDLVRHIEAVIIPLEQGRLVEARQRLSWVVGRDTEALDEPEICRAAIETIAESLNDGVIAPLFWATALGPLGALWFRATNTLDSIVGHRDARYESFGKVSARMDDVLGYLPARWTGLVVFLLGKRQGGYACWQEAKKHASPNAGFPESAMARALGVQLGGNNRYGGILHPGPTFHQEGRRPAVSDIRRALLIARNAYLTSIILALVFIAGLQASGLSVWYQG
jgi:adenosylcobinamide-phosphate synthase